METLPIITAEIDGCAVRALVDTGCGKTILAGPQSGAGGGRCDVITVDGSRVRSQGTRRCRVGCNGLETIVDAIVMEKVLPGVEAIIGMDVINRLGGVRVAAGNVVFGREEAKACAAAEAEPDGVESVGDHRITDRDFTAVFEDGCWRVSWRWKADPPVLRNKLTTYKSALKPETRADFDAEIRRWIKEGWLRPTGTTIKAGMLPLMAVVQEHKGKVRPVLDYRELNDYVESRPGADAAVCDETLRTWRRMPEPLKIVDLKSAYLQVEIDKDPCTLPATKLQHTIKETFL